MGAATTAAVPPATSTTAVQLGRCALGCPVALNFELLRRRRPETRHADPLAASVAHTAKLSTPTATRRPRVPGAWSRVQATWQSGSGRAGETMRRIASLGSDRPMSPMTIPAVTASATWTRDARDWAGAVGAGALAEGPICSNQPPPCVHVGSGSHTIKANRALIASPGSAKHERPGRNRRSDAVSPWRPMSLKCSSWPRRGAPYRRLHGASVAWTQRT
jgi:hypothetical protein